MRRNFDAVRRAFDDSLESGEDLGAGFAAVIDGETVVDLHGGWLDRARETPWTEEALPCIFSSGKAVVATLVAREVSAGRLDYEMPLAALWPEFGAAGKERITLAQAMSHQAGLCGFPDETPADIWLDHDAVCAKLAHLSPLWPVGSASGYHPQTVGFILNEVIRRASGRTIGAILREDFYEGQGTDIHCGLPADIQARTARMFKPPRAPDLGDITELKRIAFLKPWSAPAKIAADQWMGVEIPASNMHATALGLAGVCNILVAEGGVDSEVADAAFTIRISGDDLVLPFHLTWAAGLMRNDAGWFGPSRSAFGHAGSGGSAIVIDRDRRLTAAYVMNRMSPHLVGDPRPSRLFDALYDCL